ncbi:MAG: 1-phosphofructokinase family hexose kinase, partial [Acidimicrobiales bacterium]
MIVTVTPNPSVDRTLEVPRLARGEVLRATTARVGAGGKGVNVARALIANGYEALAVLPLGGGDGHLLARLLADDGIPHRTVTTAAVTRSNVTISEPDGTVTKVNAPGEPLTAAELEALIEATIAAVPGADWLVGCGSLPEGAPIDLYAALTERGHAAGAHVAIDTSGAALAAAVAARPDLIKPNLAELADLVGSLLVTVDDAIEAASQVRSAGAGAVLVSVGPRGAV